VSTLAKFYSILFTYLYTAPLAVKTNQCAKPQEKERTSEGEE